MFVELLPDRFEIFRRRARASLQKLTTILILAVAHPAFAQPVDTEVYPNNFSVQKTVPHGCLTRLPVLGDSLESEIFVDEEMIVEQSFNAQTTVRLRGWRQGCQGNGASAILFNFEIVNGQTELELLPRVQLQPAGSQIDALARFSIRGIPHFFDDYSFPLIAQNDSLNGTTLILETALSDITAEQYNGELEASLMWALNDDSLEFQIPAYDAFENPPQTDGFPLNGRLSGQWVADDLARQGLVLQIGETADRIFLFAISFTYLDGNPFWTVGNADFEPGATSVELDMFRLEGGTYFGDPTSLGSSPDVSQELIGRMTISASDCNRLEVDSDFSVGGLGAKTLEMDRLIRIAGYDCDQTK